MTIVVDSIKGKKVAEELYKSFQTQGIHANKDMPEDILPKGMIGGSFDHMIFITLTVSIDYQRDAVSLWESSRKSFEDSETRYLFDPSAVRETLLEQIIVDMKKHKLSKKPERDARIWKRNSETFCQKWDGDPRKFLEDCDWDATQILKRLISDSSRFNNKTIFDYPNLRGDKIGPLWIRMLRDNVGITNLKNLDEIPIPVDIHVARATLAMGVVKGQFRGSFNELFENIRKAWFNSVEGLSIGHRPMVALDVDEPLWHLSKYGCTKRDKITGYCPVMDTCNARDFCTPGIINIGKNNVELST